MTENVSKKVLLSEASYVEFAPNTYRPVTDDEKIAALCGYLTGDGSICRKKESYKKADGSVSVYDRLSGAFYSNEKIDLQNILSDMKLLGFCENAKVTEKKNRNKDKGFQLQFSESFARFMAEKGCPVGKKTTQDFLVPDWIMNGSMGVKRAYVAALFGAEGTLPTRSETGKSRKPRTIIMSMFKRGGRDGKAYFDQIASIIRDFSVEVRVSQSKSVRYNDKWVGSTVEIVGGEDNLIKFLSDIGYAYCLKKSDAAFLWEKYLRAYRQKSQERRTAVVEMVEAKVLYKDIAVTVGMSVGGVARMYSDIKKGKSTRAGNSFPHFKEWLKGRWNERRRLLRLNVVARMEREKPEKLFNLTVESEDNSYLLASGANTFNSFESVSGRVYYNFDRTSHVGDYKFNPDLPIWIGQDFNVNPMTSVIMQKQPNGEVWIVDEIYQQNSNTYSVCNEIERRYYRHTKNTIIYPDPAGGSRSTARGESDLDIFRERGFRRMKFRKQHPLVADRVNSVNKLLMGADGKIRLRVDRKCTHVIDSFEQTLFKPGSNDIDKRLNTEHITDALGYAIEIEFPRHKVEMIGVSI